MECGGEQGLQPSSLQQRPRQQPEAKAHSLSGIWSVFYLSGSHTFTALFLGFILRACSFHIVAPVDKYIGEECLFPLQHEQQWWDSIDGKHKCIMKRGLEGTGPRSGEDRLQGQGVGLQAWPRRGACKSSSRPRRQRVESRLHAAGRGRLLLHLQLLGSQGLACTRSVAGGSPGRTTFPALPILPPEPGVLAQG